MPKQDGIHWRMPTAMIVCFVIGVGLAIGHHFYYYSLDGTRVGDQSRQEWALRIGTGLAFLMKTFLTTAVGIACIQHFWWILRLKPIRLSTLDSMFDIRGSIFNFFDLHVWLRGPNVAILGLISWLIPLVTVITPSTLSVQNANGTSIVQQSIPVIDFGRSKYITMTQGGVDGPTGSLTRLVMSSTIQGSILQVPVPAPNASYTLDFIGPYIQCQNASDYVNRTVNEYLWDKQLLRNNYIAFFTSGNLTDDLNYLLYNNLTNYWYYHDVNTTDYAGKLIMAAYDKAPLRSVVECAMYNASYAVDFSWLNGEQSVEIANRQLLNRVFPYWELSPQPAPANEGEMLAYTAIMSALNNLLVGICFSFPQRCSSTQIFSTSLANSKELWPMVYGSDEPVPDGLRPLAEVAASMADNLTLSFFSESYFLQNSSQSQPHNITVLSNEVLYRYSQKNLFIAYGVSIFISLLCVIAGLLSMWDNGIAFSDSFSTILRATRNPKFDEIVPLDSTTGSDPPPESLARTRVQWVPSRISLTGREQDAVAGLKPLAAVAETEKGNNNSGGVDGSDGGGGRSPRSPIAFANRIRERKNYTATATVSRVDERSPGGFI
ncbi:hypothetical protein BJX64DRAFT_224225 [Aspergillus heterothallicus]